MVTDSDIDTLANGFYFKINPIQIIVLSLNVPVGIHMFTLFDASAPSWNLLVFVLLEVVVVTRVYGLDRFLDNMEEMDIKLGKITRCNR